MGKQGTREISGTRRRICKKNSLVPGISCPRARGQTSGFGVMRELVGVGVGVKRQG